MQAFRWVRSPLLAAGRAVMPDDLESASMSANSLATRRARLDAIVIDLVGG